MPHYNQMTLYDILIRGGLAGIAIVRDQEVNNA